MPKRRSHANDGPSSRPTHHQHCLYLLAEAERMIDRAAGEWSVTETASVASRLLQITEKLTRASTLSH